MKERRWYKLDNSAKIVPSMTTPRNTNVFRISCTLKEPIAPHILEYALEETCKEFPLFLCTMKSGLFWFYLESSELSPKIEKDRFNPCSKLDSDHLFKVSYYKNRINLDVYHVLTDGSGALEFLKYLVSCYLDRAHNMNLHETISTSSVYEKESDGFSKFEREHKKIKISENKRALKLKFPRKKDSTHDIIEVHMSSSKVKNNAHLYKTTVTIYMTAILIKSIVDCSKREELTKPIGITIPIDLRNVFPSATVRNFFYSVTIQYKYEEGDTFQDIIDFLKGEFERKLDKAHLLELLDTYMVLEKILLIRILPNVIKNVILGLIIGHINTSTMTFSNVGVISMPKNYEKFIESFVGIMSSNGLHLTAMSYADNLCLGFTSHYLTNEVERGMVKFLQSEGIDDIKIISNKRK